MKQRRGWQQWHDATEWSDEEGLKAVGCNLMQLKNQAWLYQIVD